MTRLEADIVCTPTLEIGKVYVIKIWTELVLRRLMTAGENVTSIALWKACLNLTHSDTLSREQFIHSFSLPRRTLTRPRIPSQVDCTTRLVRGRARGPPRSRASHRSSEESLRTCREERCYCGCVLGGPSSCMVVNLLTLDFGPPVPQDQVKMLDQSHHLLASQRQELTDMLERTQVSLSVTQVLWLEVQTLTSVCRSSGLRVRLFRSGLDQGAPPQAD